MYKYWVLSNFDAQFSSIFIWQYGTQALLESTEIGKLFFKYKLLYLAVIVVQFQMVF